MNAALLDEAEARALKVKQTEWALIREDLTLTKPTEIPPGPAIRGIHNYPKGQFRNIAHNRLKWAKPNYFEFIPKQNAPFEADISLPWRRPFGATDVQPSERCKREANYGN
jgi:hypothetical protein